MMHPVYWFAFGFGCGAAFLAFVITFVRGI